MTFCLCGHDAGSHSRLRFNCLATSDQGLRCSCGKFEPVPPASAPAATPHEQHMAVMEAGHKLTGAYIREHFVDEDDSPAATPEPETRPAATDYACPACHGDTVLADRSGAVGICACCGWFGPVGDAAPTGEEAETLRKRFDLILAHITPKISAGDVINLAMCNNEALEALTAQATALAALRARVEEIIDADERKYGKNCLVKVSARDLRAALAPRQPTGDT